MPFGESCCGGWPPHLARVWRALGQATEEFLGTVGRAFSGIVDLQAKTVNHQSEQLDKSQALVQSLATQLLAARRLKESDEAEQKVDERQLRVREELGARNFRIASPCASLAAPPTAVPASTRWAWPSRSTTT